MFDILSSCISIINNGCSGKRTRVSITYSVASLAICKLLYRDGWISSYCIVSSRSGLCLNIDIYYKFFDNKKVLSGIKLFSTPSRSLYITHKQLCKLRCNDKEFVSYYILSTNKGIISSEDAFLLGIGGRILCQLYD